MKNYAVIAKFLRNFSLYAKHDPYLGIGFESFYDGGH